MCELKCFHESFLEEIIQTDIFINLMAGTLEHFLDMIIEVHINVRGECMHWNYVNVRL